MKYRSVPGARRRRRERARRRLRLDVIRVAAVEDLGRGVQDRLAASGQLGPFCALGVGRELEQLRGLAVQGHRPNEVRFRVDHVQDEVLGEPLAADQRRLVDRLQGLQGGLGRGRGVGRRLRERLRVHRRVRLLRNEVGHGRGEVREDLVSRRRLRLTDRREHGVDLSLERAHGGPHPPFEIVLLARVALSDEAGDQPDDHQHAEDAEDHQPELALGEETFLDGLIDGLGPSGDGLRASVLCSCL